MTLRRALIGGACAAALIGCLFPSFDDLKKDEKATPNADDDDRGDDDDTTSSSSSGGGSSSSGDSGTSSSSSGGPADTGADTTTGPKPAIVCGSQTCDVATQLCCDEGFGNVGCKTKGSACTPWKFECDDFGDCPDGQRCCHDGATAVKCAASCGGQTEICNVGKPCRTGTCGGELIGPPDVRVRKCE